MLQGVQTGNNISGLHADRLGADIRLLSQQEVLLSEPVLPWLNHINKNDSCPTRPTRPTRPMSVLNGEGCVSDIDHKPREQIGRSWSHEEMRMLPQKYHGT